MRHVNGSIDLTVTDDGWGVDMHQLTRLCSEPSGDNQQQQQHHGRSRRNMTRSDHVLWAACALSREIEVCSRSVGELTGYRAVFSAEVGLSYV